MYLIVRLSFLLAIVTVALGAQVDADTAETKPAPKCIEWNVKTNQNINKRQAERLYVEAWRWVAEHFSPKKDPSWPCIKVSVGSPCPDSTIKNSCVNPTTGEVYIPKWTATSAGTVAQGTINTMLLRLAAPGEIAKAVQLLLKEDENTFLDFPSKGTGR